MTQNQLIELLESEHLKALIERAEEHGGHLEPAELEAFVLEHDLGEDEAELLHRELEAHGIEIPQADGETNASLRKGDTVEGLTAERAFELLAERRAKSA